MVFQDFWVKISLIEEISSSVLLDSGTSLLEVPLSSSVLRQDRICLELDREAERLVGSMAEQVVSFDGDSVWGRAPATLG